MSNKFLDCINNIIVIILKLVCLVGFYDLIPSPNNYFYLRCWK